MVFESIVTDLMNRFLGDFIENLDHKQLNIGIWGGDVVLKNLQLKQSALKDLDLPVQLVYGQLGKLILKIPWKNLYSLPVEADVEDLYLLIAPNSAISYDPTKQKKIELEGKKGELNKLEEARKQELEKNKPKADKSFTEKLVAQIINNVQIRIRNVHVRYEDRSTSTIPFAFGITLGGLEVHTTDADWRKAFLSEALSKVFKVAKLDGLAVYMNCNTQLFQSRPDDDYQQLFMDSIATSETRPENFTYVLGPITSVAKLKLNMNPELDSPPFEIPKVDLYLEMEKLSVGITRAQYQRLIGLADGMSAMTRGVPYRKFRPFNTPYKGNARVWWKFAYESILETEIKRRKKNWSWENMRNHRNMCRLYAEAYRTKLISKKLPNDVQQCIDQYEERLDIFNLILIRNRVDLEVEKSGKVQKPEAEKGGWFSSWWGGSKTEDSTDKDQDILDQFKTAMTSEEKSKLYQAIGYHEDGVDPKLPEDYVALRMHFNLKMLQVCVCNEIINPANLSAGLKKILSLQVSGVTAEIDQRPASSGLKVDLKMKEFSVAGYKQGDFIPIMVKSILGQTSDSSLLDIKFEMNPLDKGCDQRLDVIAQPLQIVYDAETVIQLLQVFKVPSNANLSDLTDAAVDKLSNFKERSATGIQYVIEKHTRLEMNVSIQPNYVIIPHGGKYIENEVMIVSLGSILLRTEPRSEDMKDVAAMHVAGATSEDILKEMMDQAYDKFSLNIDNIQILLTKSTNDWQEALTQGKISKFHILEPTSLQVRLALCVVGDDPRLPKTRIHAKIPSIGVSVTEQKVLDALALAMSIPLPESDTTPMPLNKESLLVASSMSLKRYLDERQSKPKKLEIQQRDISDEEITQYTDLEFGFELNEVSIKIFKESDQLLSPSSSNETPIEEYASATGTISTQGSVSELESIGLPKQLSFTVRQLEMSAVQRTYDIRVSMKLGAISMSQYYTPVSGSNEQRKITMIETPRYAETNDYLLSLLYTNANKNSPEFTTKYKFTEQLIEINFTILILNLHQEGLTEILRFANNFQAKMDAILNKSGTDRMASAGPPLETIEEGDEEADIENDNNIGTKSLKRSSSKISSIVDSIKVKLIAKMEQVSIGIENEKRPITNLKIQNLNAGVIMKTSYTELNLKLQDIIVEDLNSETIHSTILTVVGGDALSCQIVLFNVEETSVYNDNDMKIDVSMGCVKIVFLNWFVTSVLNFLDNFQAAQQAIADASAAAAETAKQNVVEAYSNAKRMLLNIRIKAPIIIVPVDSKSLNAISIDLGHLCITNVCFNIPNSSVNDRSPAILDEMKLELKDMKISKVKVCRTSEEECHSDVSYGLKNDENILNPTSFALIIKRNLSSGWYREIPELDISGRLKSIVINLLATDYQLLMSILSKNMTEGANERIVVTNKPVTVTTPTSTVQVHTYGGLDEIGVTTVNKEQRASKRTNRSSKISSKPKTSGSEIPSALEDDGTKSVAKKKIDTFLQFSFQMDSIVLNLYTTSIEGLASFGIHFLSLKGCKLVDESMSASIVLCDVQLDDIRPNRQNFITRFMKKKEIEEPFNSSSEATSTIPSSSSTSMVDIVVRIKEDETFANLKVSSFDLILSLEFLMKIAQFVSVPQDPSSKSISANTATSAASKASEVAPVAETDPNKKMTILINIEQPDIILVEAMNDINCLALILNTQIVLRVRMQGEQQVIEGEIGDLKFYLCEFNPARRNATKHFIIQPCTISLHGNTPESNGMNIGLTTSDIRINISPAIIEIVNKAVSTVTTTDTVAEKCIVEELPDCTDLWQIKKYTEDDFWFMKVEEAEEALVNDYIQPTFERKPEVCIIDVPSVVIVIETGFGYYTYPMLVIETKMNAQIRDWSSEISIQSSLLLGMAYYNSTLAVWEPLIEPNERKKTNGLTEYEPWQLNLSLKIEKPAESSVTESEPKTKMTISSNDTLEISVTKTCLDVLQDLGQAFSDAIRPQGLNKPDIIAPYIVENDTGFDIIMNLSKGSLNLHSSHLPQPDGTHNDSLVVFNITTTELDPNQITTCKVSPGGRVYLQPKREHSLSKITAFCTNEQSKRQETLLNVQIGDIDEEITLPVHKADRRYFPLYRDTNQEPWAIISHVHTEYGSTVITIHGVLKVKNHFSTAVNIFRKRNGNLIEIGQVEAGSTFNVPLHALYAAQKELFFSISNYKTSVQGFNWKENPSDTKYMKYLQCDPIHTFEPFYITAIREREEVYHELTSKHKMPSVCYVINLKPPLYLRNALPIDIQISVAGCTVSQNESIALNDTTDNNQQGINYKGPLNVSLTKSDFLDYGEKVVKPGDLLHLPTVKTTAKEGERRSLLVARLVQYLEKDWSCTTEIPANPPEFAVWSFHSYDSDEMMSIELGVQFDNRLGSLQLTVYCPFWMINKTDLMLSYRSADENVNVLYHPPDLEGPILFSYREKVFFGKKRASVRVENGDWSEKFALDAAGSTGLVECKAAGVNYEIAVQNTLTHNSLTKQITFMPFYVVINKAPFTIQVQENKRPGDPWLIVHPEQCVPLWPKSGGNTLHVRVGDDETVSRPFKFTDPQCTLLKLKNRYGGINVDVHVSEGGVYITFSAYHPGDAPALIINHTNEAVKFWEKGNVNERHLEPFEQMLYTWQNPAGDRIILWGEEDEVIENDLRRDGIKPIKGSNNDIQSYWVSFLDGTQRVLLFTKDYNIAYGASSASRLDKVTQEIEVDIHGIGLSLVNNIKQCDIMYIGIASSGVIWEEKKKSRYFKQMKIQEVQTLEDHYQQYLRNRQVGINDHNLYFDSAGKIAIDFDNMVLRKSNAREIRRTIYPGLWIHLKSSPYQLQLHAKINRIQIDNQLADCIFPVVLAPVAPPKSVAASIELKPFVECSIVQRIIPHSNVKQFKYLRVLTQEFHVKVDLLFINEIAEMLTAELTDEEKRKLFNTDIAQHSEPLSALVLTQSTQDQKNFYDQLHLGPLKIHISFSMAGLEPGALPPVLSTILQGVGVTLTDINDIVFRLTFFEREYNFFTQKQLTSEIVSHYTNQAVKQAYVLILGLDVIGNPYGLVVGFTKGVEDLFYEPFQGAIQGPSEFAEGLVLGVKSLFGHTVGGAAGAVSKITGAMGKGLAALTFDKDYQKKRREQMNKKPANLHEGLARCGQGLVMGVVDGVTGVVTQPISGARNDGFEGFFKGLGKGAVGLIARPTAGLVDFASGSFDAVKRATEMSEDVNRLRPPRSLHSDGVLRPFCLREAEGNKLLKEIEKGKYATSDIFVYYEIIHDKREVLILSDHRVIYCEKNDLFGGWQIGWSYRWNEIDMLRAVNKGIEILIGEKSKKVLGLFGSNEQKKKIILMPEMARRDRLLKIMDELKSTEP